MALSLVQAIQHFLLLRNYVADSRRQQSKSTETHWGIIEAYNINLNEPMYISKIQWDCYITGRLAWHSPFVPWSAVQDPFHKFIYAQQYHEVVQFNARFINVLGFNISLHDMPGHVDTNLCGILYRSIARMRRSATKNCSNNQKKQTCDVTRMIGRKYFVSIVQAYKTRYAVLRPTPAEPHGTHERSPVSWLLQSYCTMIEL